MILGKHSPGASNRPQQKSIHHSNNSGLDLNRSVNVMDSKSFTINRVGFFLERYEKKGHEMKPTRKQIPRNIFYFVIIFFSSPKQ